MKKIGGFLKQRFKQADMFSKSVSLSYKQKEHFQCVYGGIVSTVIFTILVSYGIQVFIQMITKGATDKSRNSIMNDPSSLKELYTFGPDDIGLAVMLARTNTSEGIECLSLCRELSSNNEGIDKFRPTLKTMTFCPSNSTFTVGGSMLTDIFKNVQINIRKCVNGTSVICKSKSEIEGMAKSMTASLIFGAKYFDFDDYKEPIKKFYDNRLNFLTVPTFKKFFQVLLRKNKVSLSDSILPLGGGQEESFYSIGDYQSDFSFVDSSDPSLLMQFEIRQDTVVDSYERRVYTFLDFSGQLGGFFEILVILGGIIVNHFSSKLYNYSMFNKLYCVDQRDSNEKSINAEVAPKSKVFDHEISKEYISKSNSNSSSINFNKSNDSECKKSQDSDLLHKVKHNLNSQRRYNFTAKEYIKSCIPFIANKSKRQFTALSDRFSDECDLPSILRSIRQLKTMMHLVLSEHQILLMGFDVRAGVRYNSRVEINPMTPVDMPPVGEARSNSFSEKIENLIRKLKEVSKEQLSKDAATILGIDTSQENEVSAKHETVTKDKSFSKVGLIEEQKENVDWVEYPVKNFKDI
ncbi:unnamed protein product [Moneuplotes crassus]|uniref:Uncharacterized protein n=1 Tax=Euplotes crassus TaxID=5936 RepID=A0AAD1UAM6_EUPCR|nr:unnamed protein product [Moneuplotes crassus]